jgi:hypothetical protein
MGVDGSVLVELDSTAAHEPTTRIWHECFTRSCPGR